MEQRLKKLQEEFQQDLAQTKRVKLLEELKVKYLGRKSELAELFSQIPVLAKEERGYWGKRLNEVKQEMTEFLYKATEGSVGASSESIDVTFPATSVGAGSRHIINVVSQKICSVFERLGFDIVEGAEIEDEWHNFDALNFPKDHPSRDDFDTFYLDLPSSKGGKHLLRCHTSPSQIRVMQKIKPPLAVISPGRVYRPDEVDASHSFMFSQIEGFAVGRDINFAHLKGVLLSFARELFSNDVELRFRPHFFPFTEPSAEVDLSCIICKDKKKSDKDKKCSVCKDKGWLEILGCGMIHPKVLELCGIDSKKYQGFAFGMGVERITMLKYGIDDIRLFYENDLRFLEQFSM
ncbi:MAG: phenylalanine--tRNA ligase subunit alpha [Candidatus Omnitrophica bacterium]|nr:phenylalanine--tRNA ligase subunit alpha [Candidatus Omnitrophota bacterium]